MGKARSGGREKNVMSPGAPPQGEGAHEMSISLRELGIIHENGWH